MAMFDSIMVIHFTDGRIIKGFGSIIAPGETVMEFKDLEEKIYWVELNTIKGAFYVKTFEGSPKKPRSTQQVWNPHSGQKVRITFKDGEVMEGIVNDVTRLAAAEGFYVVPNDPASNNYRIWINRAAVDKVHHILNMIDEKRVL
jgi:hypothetical protein